jgi:hypothetical protein
MNNRSTSNHSDSPTTMINGVAVPARAVLDAIMSGLGGGIQYWAQVVRCRVEGRTRRDQPIEPDVHLVCDLIAIESRDRFSLRGKWMGAVALMAAQYPHRFSELVGEAADASTGDVLIQLAAFGELRYG